MIVILASYDYWGEDCLNVNGMWSFVIYNKSKTDYLFQEIDLVSSRYTI